MADHRQPGLPGDDADAAGISELQVRLNELQRNVELLGTQGVWAANGTEAPAPPPIADPAPPPLPSAPLPPPTYAGASDAIPPQPPPLPYSPPAPAATNAHGTGEPGVSAPSATVALVDAGPFADLIELRHFEDDLVTLTAVHDVRVRRFGHGRAQIEVGMDGPYDLSLELPRLGLPMDVAPGPEGELVIEFAPLPVHGPEAAVEDPGAPPDSRGVGE